MENLILMYRIFVSRWFLCLVPGLAMVLLASCSKEEPSKEKKPPAEHAVADSEKKPADVESAGKPGALLPSPRPFATLWAFQIKPDRLEDFEALSALHSKLTFLEGGFLRWELIRSLDKPGQYWTQQVTTTRDDFAFHLSPEAPMAMSHGPIYGPMNVDPDNAFNMVSAGDEIITQRVPYGQKTPHHPELGKQGGKGEAWEVKELEKAKTHYATTEARSAPTFVSIERFVVPTASSQELEAALSKFATTTLATDDNAYRLDIIKGTVEGGGSKDEAGNVNLRWFEKMNDMPGESTHYHLIAVFATQAAYEKHVETTSSQRQELAKLSKHEVIDRGIQLLAQREPFTAQ